jgi:hypothetical protein
VVWIDQARPVQVTNGEAPAVEAALPCPGMQPGPHRRASNLTIAVTLAASLAACGGSTTSGAAGVPTDHDASEASDVDGGLQCRWPASLNDAAPGECHAARAFVNCSYTSGAGCGCLSSDPTMCPNCGPSNGATCQDRCTVNEYAVACGGIGPPTMGAANGNAQPPDTCHAVGAVPSGTAFYCCPCE